MEIREITKDDEFVQREAIRYDRKENRGRDGYIASSYVTPKMNSTCTNDHRRVPISCNGTTENRNLIAVSFAEAHGYEEDEKENAIGKRVNVDLKVIRCDRDSKKDNDMRRQTDSLQAIDLSRRFDGNASSSLCIDRIVDSSGVKKKIPRPANAFMLFANEWRKKLAAENPRESNKDISVRLGILWKNMTKDTKEKYFALAREVDAEHKRKYPDYVYNPKEARLRKAMREQSRELSRRSILQSAIASTNSRSNAINGSSVSVSVSSEFLDHHHHHHRFGCVTASAVSSVPIVPTSIEPHRVTEPWFHASHRSKLPLPGRNGDWYGTVDGDPIERLQAMGAAHQRNFDKPGKDVRNQNAECAFSNGGYGADFVNSREREMRRQEGEYGIADFSDGQKWHPYQNGASPHAHARMPHPQAQIPGILQPNVQNASSHGHGHGAWGQFCHGALPREFYDDIPTVTRNIAIRGPRHAVFLRDRLPNRYCSFSDEPSKMPYVPNKLDVDAVRTSYPTAEHQMPRLIESSVESSMEPTSTMTTPNENDNGTRWEQNSLVTDMTLENLVPTSTQQEPVLKREIDRESRRSTEKYESKKRTNCKTPLPGFHQAFGSTEIGKFSRSELFVNMVGENNSIDTNTSDSECIPDAYLTTPIVFPIPSTSCNILGTSSTIRGIIEDGEFISRILPDDCCWFAAQTGHALSRIPEDVMNCTAFFDCSRGERNWIRHNGTIASPPEIQAILRHQNGDYTTFFNKNGRHDCIVVSTERNENDENLAEKESDREKRSGIFQRSSIEKERKEALMKISNAQTYNIIKASELIEKEK